MPEEASHIRVRSVRPEDERQWRRLWQGYCDFYGVSIAPDVTGTLWRRLETPEGQVRGLVAELVGASASEPELLGIANYVLHPYTWGLEQVCYLEDLFVEEKARGRGVGSALIDALIALAKANNWPRLYWHTHKDNEVARSLYERFTPVDPFVRYLILTR